MELANLYIFLKKTFTTYVKSNILEIVENGNKIIIDTEKQEYEIDGGIKHDHSRIFDLKKVENWSVLILLLKLFRKGYSKEVIYLEKCWQLGHNESGYLDVMLTNPQNNFIYMIEVKTKKEITSYTNISKPQNLKQSLSYAMQEKNTKLVSYYSYDFDNNVDLFFNIYLQDILEVAANTEDLFDRWNKIFDRDDFVNNNTLFNIHPQIITYTDLNNITEETTKLLYKQFITILRLNSVSDKPNAFNKMINLFLAKIVDESQGDIDYTIQDKNNLIHNVKGLCFQYIPNLDTPESFMKRLNELYKKGMEQYLNKEIIDYSDKEVAEILQSSDKDIWRMVDDLRLKKNNNFSFIDVYDDYTFKQNFYIVRDVVNLFQSQQFKYDYKQQFLGDFFEDLLNTSLKQEAGQFFTPYPLVDFITQSIPFGKIINRKILNREKEIIPSTIDYACGAGHFLVSAMSEIQKNINNINSNQLPSRMANDIKIYKDNPFRWVSTENIVGIEKDYRLAKTTKIATFLNGDGEAEIISGDGINKFCSNDYKNTILASDKNDLNYFDVLISNPPYSIEGFMYNFQKNNIIPNDGTFSLLKKYKFSDAMIETFFVERAYQLLNKNGIASIILPQSILNLDKYQNLRDFIFSKFKIKALLLTSDITFLGTTTSPVVLFLEKGNIDNLDYKTMLIFSDKYFNIKTKKSIEENFLGYKFSSDRKKSGTKSLKNSKLKLIQPLLLKFLEDSVECEISQDLNHNILYTKLSSIIIETEKGKQIFPKYNVTVGKTLNELNVELNPLTVGDTSNLKYVEISNIINQKIKASDKDLPGKICLPGDILFSSLTPSKDKIAIADQTYKISSAIYIIRVKDIKIRDKIFNELGKDYVIKQMCAFSTGFKLTYSKIKDEKLYNYIKLDIK